MFSGPGGLALAATSARVDAGEDVYSISHAWATDYDKDTCETYRQNICLDNLKTVVHKLDIKRLEKISKIDALAFSFPCNDFIIVGEQKRVDDII